MADEQHENEIGQEGKQARKAERQSAICEFIDKPANADINHHRGEGGEKARREIKGEVAIIAKGYEAVRSMLGHEGLSAGLLGES